MLNAIRERSQGIIAWILVGLIAITFAIVGIENFFGGGTSPTVAKVNGELITQIDLSRDYERVLRQELAQGNSDILANQEQAMMLRKEVLDQLVRNIVLSQGAHEAGFIIPEKSVDHVIVETAAFQLGGQFSPELFQSLISQAGFTLDEVRNDVATSLLTNQIEFGIRESSFVTPQEVEQIISLYEQTRDFGYVIFPVSKYRAQVKLDEEDYKNYYDQHSLEFIEPEQVSVEYIRLSLADIEKEVTVSDADIKQYYENTKEQYTTPERREVAHILIDDRYDSAEVVQEKLAAVKKGIAEHKDFAKLAEEYSGDSESAQQGGDLGWINRDEMEPAFDKAAFALAKAGDISEPIHTQFGYHFIKLVKIEPEKITSFDEVSKDIKTSLIRQRAEQLFYTRDELLNELSYDHPDSLESAADAVGVDIVTTDLFPLASGGSDPIIRDGRVRQAILKDQVLLQGENSDVVELPNNVHVVLRVKEYIPAAQLAYEKVHDQVVSRVVSEHATQMAQEAGENFISKIEDEDPAYLAKELGLEWVAKKNVNRRDRAIPLELMEAAFALSHPGQDSPAPTKGIALVDGDYAVIDLTAVYPGELHENASQMEMIYSQGFNSSLGELEYQLHVRELYDHANISISELTPEEM